MLRLDEVAGFLLGSGLLDASSIIGGELTIRCLARRNRNVRVEVGEDRGWFIKQPDDPGDGGPTTLRRESAFHAFCRDEPAAAPIRPLLPRLLATRDPEPILVYELIVGAVTAAEWLGDGEGRCVEAAKVLGSSLGTLHRTFRRSTVHDDPRPTRLQRDPPPVLSLHEPSPRMLAEISPANLETLRILQGSRTLESHLDRCRAEWRPETVIHGDVRLSNVLVRGPTRGSQPHRVELWLTDWELAGLGDPAWDIACALQDYLVAWITSMPLVVGVSARELSTHAMRPLEVLRHSMRAIWTGYCEGSEASPAESEALLDRAVAFSVARLVQSAYEIAAEAERLPGHAVLLLQLAANLAAEPGHGRTRLFGLPPGSSGP